MEFLSKRYHDLDDAENRSRSGALGRLVIWVAGLIIQVFQLGEAERRAQVFPQFGPVLFGNRKKYFHDLGIKLSSRAPAYLFSRVGHRQSLAVRPVADHGIHCVGKRKDSRAKRNLLAAQSSRITGAVKKLLVRKHDLRRIAKKR